MAFGDYHYYGSSPTWEWSQNEQRRVRVGSVSDDEFEAYRDSVVESLEAEAEQVNMEDLPVFDPLAHCIKCGNSIPEPVKVELPSPATKPTAKKESAAAATPQAPGFALPPSPAPATVDYCSGAECPWLPDTEDIGEHMHQWCDVCGFEWLSRPLDWQR